MIFNFNVNKVSCFKLITLLIQTFPKPFNSMNFGKNNNTLYFNTLSTAKSILVVYVITSMCSSQKLSPITST